MLRIPDCCFVWAHSCFWSIWVDSQLLKPDGPDPTWGQKHFLLSLRLNDQYFTADSVLSIELIESRYLCPEWWTTKPAILRQKMRKKRLSCLFQCSAGSKGEWALLCFSVVSLVFIYIIILYRWEDSIYSMPSYLNILNTFHTIYVV